MIQILYRFCCVSQKVAVEVDMNFVNVYTKEETSLVEVVL